MTSAEEYAQFALAHLPELYAQKWISLLRPAVQFPDAAAAAGERPALRLGGNPQLPDEVAWPAFEGYGPLSFIAELDCAAVAAVAAVGRVDLMPETGHLLFFCVDERYDGPGQEIDYPRHLTAWTAGRVIHVPDGRPRRYRTAPEGLEPYESGSHAAQLASTPPSTRHEFAERYFGAETAALIERSRADLMRGAVRQVEAVYPLWADEFASGVHDLRATYSQCGGHSYPVQGPAELEAARDAIDAGLSAHVSVLDEAEHWRVLLQMAGDEDLGMVWGDCPVAYWMIRDDDLAARRFDRVWFTMQN